jgi:enamine deaminase RidA (YjgF/YER057c/UK114 family)
MLSVLHPPHWNRPKGYSSAMMGEGRFVLVSGQIGWDEHGVFAEGFVGQTGQALRNILAILAEAKAGPEHVARLVWYVTDMTAYRAAGKALGPVWREIMGRHYPAMAVIGVSSLVEPQAVVEIEAVALLPA